ncbi:MAG: type II toxin-antitoxin system VapC family toxin [Thiomargarita sp.]|nr:type II toxin-antitoxin system VapC family toxin [Thiomargarita sp.]
MRFLLDTHTFIWWYNEPDKLSLQVRALLQNSENIILLSVVTPWEMQIKLQTGKLKLDIPLDKMLENQLQANNIDLLPVTLPHVLALQNLPYHHKDPFDRLLIAQSNVEKAILLSKDAIFSKYNIKLLW